MLDTRTQALVRPAHPLDLPAATVWALALFGSAVLSLAYALDSANARRTAGRESAERPRARLGQSRNVPADHLLPDSWRIR